MRAILTALTCSLGVLAALTLLVAAGATRALDREVTVWLQRGASPALDLLVNLHTYLGVVYVTVPLCAGASLWLWSRGRRRAAVAPLFVVALLGVELALKLLLVHPDPPAEFERVLFRVPAGGIPTPSSFPSGHAARLTFLAALAAAAVPGPVVRAAAVSFVLLTLLARVYIGDHWASDVVGGAALGIAAASAGALAARGLPRTRPSRA